jgi:hypothetical protein
MIRAPKTCSRVGELTESISIVGDESFEGQNDRRHQARA